MKLLISGKGGCGKSTMAALAGEAGLSLSLVLNKAEEAVESQIRDALAESPV